MLASGAAIETTRAAPLYSRLVGGVSRSMARACAAWLSVSSSRVEDGSAVEGEVEGDGEEEEEEEEKRVPPPPPTPPPPPLEW